MCLSVYTVYGCLFCVQRKMSRARERETSCNRMSVKSLMNARTDRLVNNLKPEDSGMEFYLSSTGVYKIYINKSTGHEYMHWDAKSAHWTDQRARMRERKQNQITMCITTAASYQHSKAHTNLKLLTDRLTTLTSTSYSMLFECIELHLMCSPVTQCATLKHTTRHNIRCTIEWTNRTNV